MKKKVIFGALAVTVLAVAPARAVTSEYDWYFNLNDVVDESVYTHVPDNSANIKGASNQAVSGLEIYTGPTTVYDLLGTNEYYTGTSYANDFFLSYTTTSGTHIYHRISDAAPSRGTQVFYKLARTGIDSSNSSAWNAIIGNTVYYNFMTLGTSVTESTIFVNNQNTCTPQVTTDWTTWAFHNTAGGYYYNGNSPYTSTGSTPCTTMVGHTSGTVGSNPVYMWIQ